MTGLIYKDIVALRKQLSTLLLFLVVYGGFCVTGVFDFSILGALVAVFGLTIPVSSVALDDAAHWDRYAVATPAGRRGVVAGKYVFTLLVIVVSVAVAAGLMVCLSLAGLTETTLDDLVLIALSCGVFLYACLISSNISGVIPPVFVCPNRETDAPKRKDATKIRLLFIFFAIIKTYLPQR